MRWVYDDTIKIREKNDVTNIQIRNGCTFVEFGNMKGQRFTSFVVDGVVLLLRVLL